MNDHGLTKENLVATLPQALRADPSVVALAETLTELLAARPAEIDRLRIYPAIDTLDEPLLDILACDFKVDWWDPECSVEQKRRMLKSSWQVHKLMGTKAAVEMAASAVYPRARVQEWYEYGGGPYRFRLDVDLPEDAWTPERHRRLMRQLQYYKNLRSHLDEVIYRLSAAVLVERTGSFRPRWLSLLLRVQAFRGEWGWDRIQFPFLLRETLRQPGAVLRWKVRIAADTVGLDPERTVFQSLRIPLRARSYGRDTIRLDGQKRLDGSWLLDQRFRGMAWDRVQAVIALREQERAGIRICSSGTARTQERAELAGCQAESRLAETLEGARPRRVEIWGAFRERNTMSGTLTRDAMWYLDGGCRLDGTRKLNAHIMKEDI